MAVLQVFMTKCAATLPLSVVNSTWHCHKGYNSLGSLSFNLSTPDGLSQFRCNNKTGDYEASVLPGSFPDYLFLDPGDVPSWGKQRQLIKDFTVCSFKAPDADRYMLRAMREGDDIPSALRKYGAAFNYFTCFHSTTDFRLQTQLNHLGEINGTVTNCALSLCARELKDVRVINNRVEIKETIYHELMLSDDAKTHKIPNDQIEWPLVVGGLGDKFNFDDSYYMNTLDIVSQVFNSDLFQFPISTWLTNTGYNSTKLAHSIASAISPLFQRAPNSNESAIIGDAYSPEIFVQIRWA